MVRRGLLPLVAVAAALALGACTPGPRNCSSAPDRFDRISDPGRPPFQEATPGVAAVAAMVAAGSMLAGDRCV